MSQPDHYLEADVEQLLQLSVAGPQVLADLDECVNRLRQVHNAKAALAQLPTEVVRDAIARRQLRMTNPGGQS